MTPTTARASGAHGYRAAMPPAPTSHFADTTTLTADPTHPGRYRTHIGAEWQLAINPQGGIVAAVAARAMAHELGSDDQALRSFTGVFAGQVGVGPVEVDVTVLRHGRSVSQATATLTNTAAEAGFTAVAVFGTTRPGFAFTDLDHPEGIDTPDTYPSNRDPWPEEHAHLQWEPRAFFEQVVETRYVTGHAPWDDYVPTGSEVVSYVRFDAPPRLADGTLDPLGLLVLADSMPSAVGERMGNDTPAWFGPSADLTFHWFGPTRSEWILVRNSARHAGDGYMSVDAELWDPTTRELIGYATQQAIFTFADGPPSPDQVEPPQAP